MKTRTDLHGLLLVDKPSGLTSHDVVSRVRRLSNTKEVGHTGTLDPLASGLMVVLLGEATKLSSLITDGDKSYEVQLQLGITTDTLDSTGQILSQSSDFPSVDHVLKSAQELSGEILLPIPLYSAKKIDGKKLYEYARENQQVEVPSKVMNFWQIENIQSKIIEKEHRYSFHLNCSKGSFIRSWVSELGQRLKCGATLTALRRTKSHDFEIKEAFNLENLLDQSSKEKLNLRDLILPISSAVKGIKSISVSGQDEVLLSNGQISHDLRSKLIVLFNPEQDQWVFILSKVTREVMAIIGLEPLAGFKIKRVFKYN